MVGIFEFPELSHNPGSRTTWPVDRAKYPPKASCRRMSNLQNTKAGAITQDRNRLYLAATIPVFNIGSGARPFGGQGFLPVCLAPHLKSKANAGKILQDKIKVGRSINVLFCE